MTSNGHASGSLPRIDSIPRIPLLRSVPNAESFDSPIDRRSDFYRQKVLHRVLERTGKLQAQPMLTLPNLCTFARILCVPLFVLLWFTTHQLASISTALVFVAAALTDWLDGYLARKLKVTSAFGAFLDPVADKIMVCTALVMLASEPPAPISPVQMAIPVALMISREITMSSLREWAAASQSGAHKAVKVNSLGKWKTALQMVAMSALLLLRNADHLLGGDETVLERIHLLSWLAWLALCAAALLAAVSLANYMSNVWHFFRFVWVEDGPPSGSPRAPTASGRKES